MRASALLPWLLGLALALETSGSLEVRLEGRYAGGVFALEPVYAGSLLVSEAWGDWLAEAALYPRWNLATQDFDAGISKLELSYGAPAYALGAGASPEPTAVLRLLSLFPLAPPRPDFAPGLWGGWLEVYPDPFTRLRLALRRLRDRPLGLFRADGRLAGVDYQLTALYGPAPSPAALGAGATVRLGPWVVYGEGWRGWRTANPWRGGVGATRYLGSGLFTIEAGYREGGQLATAYTWQASESWTVDASLHSDWALGGVRLAAFAGLLHSSDDGDVTLALGALRLPGAGWRLQPSFGVCVYY
ncbi:hypothetical protein [Oceanithermus desulfurans]|uniref:Uncharacterized protein n=2 Tax=Oceanithermus desulfurans TaxID=227924 RepID=A0A511RLE4_9DEIN|nr:hypothetical protein [Oceanithermus desulfurans]MBB6029074.1 hypothetical protein [Oceanithermus desulfurans]GEM90465.1 hypothetical protein ODE01S_18990 [Oceanithermus desulfurans NBRC 100063]